MPYGGMSEGAMIPPPSPPVAGGRAVPEVLRARKLSLAPISCSTQGSDLLGNTVGLVQVSQP